VIYQLNLDLLQSSRQMPGVSSFTPAWLSRPSPGFDFFNGGSTDKSKQAGAPSPGPARTIACRGTEIFAAFGNEIRWSDLVLLRDEWEEAAAGSKKTSVTGAQEQVDSVAYRVRDSMEARQVSRGRVGDDRRF